jgi:hypothetical protein
MSDRRSQAGCRRPGQTTARAGRSGPGPAAPAAEVPGAPPAVRAALTRLRDAAAAHDDELPEPGPPGPAPG